MNHADHVWLIEKAIPKGEGIWVDLGSGDGAFTLALRDAAGDEVTIYSVDTNDYRLEKQQKNFIHMFPKSDVVYVNADFTEPLDLPPLDGILMANSLHYVLDKVGFFHLAKQYLKPHGKLVLVEYNVDKGNMWVPYPLSFETFVDLAKKVGLVTPQLLQTIHSDFLHEMYSAVTTRMN